MHHKISGSSYTYKQLVLPSIDYCSAIWDPYTKNDISKLEMLQHRAARFVMNKPWYRQYHNMSITKILAELHWPTLQNRRKQARLILMFKIVDGKFNSSSSLSLSISNIIMYMCKSLFEICTSSVKHEYL